MKSERCEVQGAQGPKKSRYTNNILSKTILAKIQRLENIPSTLLSSPLHYTPVLFPFGLGVVDNLCWSFRYLLDQQIFIKMPPRRFQHKMARMSLFLPPFPSTTPFTQYIESSVTLSTISVIIPQLSLSADCESVSGSWFLVLVKLFCSLLSAVGCLLYVAVLSEQIARLNMKSESYIC